MGITTKKGDGGFTDFGGGRIRKDDPRIETLGVLDELDAFLADAAFSGTPGSAEILEEVRRDLWDLSEVRQNLSAKTGGTGKASGIERLERRITELEEKYSPGGFIRRWTKPAAIKLNIARTICRRAERNILRGNAGPEDSALPVYVNRLSDLLFLLAAAAENATATRSA
jgi:cob(I)alamin adenosyltransferase